MKSKQQGYIITATMVLVFTVGFIGLLVGITSVKNAWFKKKTFENSIEVFVYDQNGIVLGKAVDYDEHEAPLIPFVDYDVPAGSGDNYRVLIGVRDDRFSGREKLYYTSNNCTLGVGDSACIFVPGTETSGANSVNSEGLDGLTGTGGVSYQVATQGDINYAIGSTAGGLPGRLYRQSDTLCDATITQNIHSYWMSQAVVWQGGTDSGIGTMPPCYEFQFLSNPPANGTFFTVVSVGGATNVLDNLSPPFLVNYPVNPDNFATLAGDGEE